MTATMIATLVEEGKLDWSSTIRKVFPARSKELHPDFKDVNLWQLLTHRAGLPANGPWWELKGRTTTEKRRDLLIRMMKDAPLTKPGTTHAYSNVGYAIAGLMAEQVTDHSWEDLMRDAALRAAGDDHRRLRRRRARPARSTSPGATTYARQGRAHPGRQRPRARAGGDGPLLDGRLGEVRRRCTSAASRGRPDSSSRRPSASCTPPRPAPSTAAAGSSSTAPGPAAAP